MPTTSNAASAVSTITKETGPSGRCQPTLAGASARARVLARRQESVPVSMMVAPFTVVQALPGETYASLYFPPQEKCKRWRLCPPSQARWADAYLHRPTARRRSRRAEW